MKIRVLGCSGAIAAGCRTTSFLIDDVLLVDAGTGVGDLTLDEMARIDDVLLTHSHLDHIAALPLMADAIGGLRPPGRPIRVHALAGTLNALRTHLFNDVIWPDFTRLPSPGAPFITLHPVEVGQVFTVAGGALQVEVLPAVHTVPAVGYAVATATQSAAPTAAASTAVDDASPWWVFTGDTGRNPAFWKRIATMKGRRPRHRNRLRRRRIRSRRPQPPPLPQHAGRRARQHPQRRRLPRLRHPPKTSRNRPHHG